MKSPLRPGLLSRRGGWVRAGGEGKGWQSEIPTQSEGRCVPKGPGALGLVENEAAFDAGLSTGSTDDDTWPEPSFPGILPTDSPDTPVYPPRFTKGENEAGRPDQARHWSQSRHLYLAVGSAASMEHIQA